MKYSKSAFREAYIIILGSVICSIPFLAQAQSLDSGFGMGQTIFSASLDNPAAVTQVDWNGNGEQDVLALGNGQRRFIVFEHQDKDDFRAPRRIGKFNADAKNLVVQDKRPEGDLIFWLTTDNTIRKFVKKSDSVVYRKTITENSYNVNNLNLMDVDHDGDKDLLFLNSEFEDENYSFDLNWIETQQGDTYSNIKSLPGDAYSNAEVLTEDVDNNGYKEIIVVSEDGYDENISITNIGFDEEKEAYEATEQHDSTLVSRPHAELSDFDNDGDQDLLVAGSVDARLMRVKLHTNRQGTLDSVRSITRWGAIKGARIDYFSVSDFDADNDKDLFAKLTYYKEKGEEHVLSYREHKSNMDFDISYLPENYERRWDIFNEYNSSSDKLNCKLIGSSRENSIALVCYDNENDTWMRAPNYVYDPIASPLQRIKSINVDNDNSEEIIAISPYGYRERLVLLKPEIGKSDEVETKPIVQTQISSMSGRLPEIKISDINEDGYDDVMYATPVPESNDNYKIAVLLNSSGNFSEPIYFANEDTIKTRISGLYSTDLEQDGLKDIVLMTSEGSRLVVKMKDNSTDFPNYKKHLTYYSYQGNKNFSKVDTILRDYKHEFHNITDINSDNYPDLIFHENNRQVYIARNNQGSDFDSLKTRANFKKRGGFNVTDLNSDGSPELIKNIRDSTAIDVYQNEASGEWTKKVNSFNINGWKYRFRDFNGDDNSDIVYMTGHNKKLMWRKNLNGYEFSESKLVDNGFGYSAYMEIAEVDSDGKSDILMVTNENKITWYQNTTSISISGNYRPREFKLYPNFPNPFNPATTIRYQLPKRTKVSLTVYNVAGKEVAQLIDKQQPAGEHQIKFDAENLGSGVYFFHIEAGKFTETQKMTLIK